MAQAVEEQKTKVYKQAKPRWRVWAKWIILALLGIAFLSHAWVLFHVFRYRSNNPDVTALQQQRISEADAEGRTLSRQQTWVPYERISSNLVRAVLAGE